MSERTTIGGTTYETIGSSSANLLLKCNGTARIQWGNKLIDLIKNGKIVSGDSSMSVSIIKDSSEIKSDGFYVIELGNNVQLWICKNGKQYNLTGLDLYISANTKQDITAEQKEQALSNIGMYYNTLEDVKKSEIKNGIVYVLEDSNLYTIKNGEIAEFEAKLRTVTVEQEEETGEIINSSFKVVLSVLDDEYLVLENQKITANYSIHVKEHAQIGSENADEFTGYRLYIDGGKSCLDVDKINVRDGIPVHEYLEVTFNYLITAIQNSTLKPHQLYLITDFQNHWKIPTNNIKYNRPILIRALSNSTLYDEGQLFEDIRTTIHYDPFYQDEIVLLDSSGNPTDSRLLAKGRITWMKDAYNNEANFDFMDYEDAFGNPLTTLHISDRNVRPSIFPTNSHDNKLTVHNLKGTVLKEGLLDNSNTSVVDFQFDDSDNTTFMEMYNNDIDCYGIILSPICNKFNENYIKESGRLQFDSNSTNNTFKSIYTTAGGSVVDSLENVLLLPTIFTQKISDSTINGFINSSITGELNKSTFDVITNSSITKNITNSIFKNITNCNLNAFFTKVQFENLINCIIDEGYLENITCRSNVESLEISQESHAILYDQSKVKDVYFSNGQLQIVDSANSIFIRGMIVMHAGNTAIPEGWAICDGNTYTYEGITTTTPNLLNRFIKAVGTAEEVKAYDNSDLTSDNEFTLQKEHLPQHSHPHNEHTHNISEITGTIENSNNLELELTNSSHIDEVTTSTTSVVKSVTAEGVTSETIDVISEVSTSSKDAEVSGGNHTHSITISGGTIEATTSEESQQTWENKAFKIEPNYYSLIFIMKL